MIDNDIIVWKERVQKEIAEESGFDLKEQVRRNEEVVKKIEDEMGINSRSTVK